MAHDQIFTCRDDFGVELKIIPVALNLDKGIHLLHIFEENHSLKKKFIRNELVLVGDQILTSTFTDSVHLMEEVNLFDIGNEQNKYFKPEQKHGIKNLRLKHEGDDDIFISKSEAKVMYKIFNLAFIGYSVATVLENEFKLTSQLLTQILHHNKLLEKRSK